MSTPSSEETTDRKRCEIGFIAVGHHLLVAAKSGPLSFFVHESVYEAKQQSENEGSYHHAAASEVAFSSADVSWRTFISQSFDSFVFVVSPNITVGFNSPAPHFLGEMCVYVCMRACVCARAEQ